MAKKNRKKHPSNEMKAMYRDIFSGDGFELVGSGVKNLGHVELGGQAIPSYVSRIVAPYIRREQHA